MSDFKTVTPPFKLPDPTKRVCYNLGMVLGVDEFLQEQAYFIGKNRLHHRMLHGYGTVSGLHLSSRSEDDGLEIFVSAGRAIDPLGQDIYVTHAQCAKINQWVKANAERLGLPEEIPPIGVHKDIYLVLCYRECKTDFVPIPGKPCRSAEDNTAASRLQDDFELRLSLTPPQQVEEEAIRRFGNLLSGIEITGDAPIYTSREELLDLVRGVIEETGSPPLESPPMASPPDPEQTVYLDPATACEDLRTAFRVWVTEIRPQLVQDTQIQQNNGTDTNCLLLARIGLNITSGLTVDNIEIDQSLRPYLLQTRVLQEWLMCGKSGQASGSYTVVAAGHFAISTLIDVGAILTEFGAIHNGLSATLQQIDGVRRRILLTFPDYLQPQTGSVFNYILKTTVQSTGATPAHSLDFIEYTPAGIVVELSSINNTVGFMVEISMIGSPA